MSFQDNFRATSNLTLNIGLRYERQTFTDADLDFSPRLGFSYDLAGQATTVIHGGFGIYYGQVVDNSEANYALTGPTGVFNYTAAPGQIGFPSSIQVDPFVERRFSLGTERLQMTVRAEAFNVFNHANFVGYRGTYGDKPAPGVGFGQPLTGITNQLSAGTFQFSGS